MSLPAITAEHVAFGATVRAEESARRIRAIDATLELVTLRDVRSISLGAVAGQAGTSRATLYRWFPGGRDELLDAALQTEMTRFFCALSTEVAQAHSVEETCVAFLLGAAQRLQPADSLATLLDEQGRGLRAPLTFDGLDQALRVGADFLWPFLGRWMDIASAKRAAELCVRVGLSYHFGVGPTVDLLDVTEVRALVSARVVPSVNLLCLQSQTRGSESHVDH